MRCRSCEYRLWALPTRQCPECGTAFLPSEFDFAPGSVQFCCPHCKQAYYGTDAKGHLKPKSFECVSCHKHIHMDEMVLLPAEGLEEEQTEAFKLPWLDRERIGTLRGLYRTIGLALIHPMRLIRAVPVNSLCGEAWAFAVLVNMLVMVTGAGLFVFFIAGTAAFSSGGGPGAFGACMGTCCSLAMPFVCLLVAMLLWGLVAHGLLRLTGETAGGLRRTLHAIYYSAGANVVSGIPCIGPYFGWIWWIVSAVLMVKEGQRVGGGRATLAVVTGPGLALMIVVGIYTTLILSVMGAGGLIATEIATSETEVVAHAVLEYSDDHGGSRPTHAIELVDEGHLAVGNFVATGTATTPNTVRVGGVTLRQLDSLSPDRRDKAVEAIVESLPEDVVAHRLGDFVFVYHGISHPPPAPRLWLVLMSTEPIDDSEEQHDQVIAGCADGSVFVIPGDEFTASLRQQNDLRRKHGLPPIPDPSIVTHDRPAVSVQSPPR